jgi:streptogramin lyase
VKCIFQDQAGTIWIGTYNGLNKADQSPSRFPHFCHDSDDPSSLSDNIVYSILEDHDGQLWLGTYGGVNVFNRKAETFSVYRHEPGDARSLSEDKIRALALDSSHMVWAGTEFKGLNRIDPETGLIKRYRHDPDDPATISHDEIYFLYVSPDGNLWVSTGEGLDVVDVHSGRVIRRFKKNENSPQGLSDDVVWSMMQDRKGNLWIGTGNGLNVFDQDLNRIRIYRNDFSNPSSLRSNWIFSIYEDEDGIIWVGTMGGGLSRIDPLTGLVRNYDESDGLPNNVVYAILEDNAGSFWMSTNSGLSRFNRQTGTFVNYDTKDGIQGNEFNAGAYFKNRNGEMFFGGMNGFNVFFPSDITLNRIPPIVVLTRFSVMNETVDTDLENGEVFRLGHLENFFSIEFSALDYTNPPKNLYRYQLENYDAEWVYAGSDRRRAEYRKVNPGTYTFKVTGSNNDGIWNEDGVSLKIIVAPPWWQSWWFRLTAFILITVILWNIVYFRTRSIKRKHEVEKKMLDIEKQVFELEQKALQLQMNPHFIFNSLNAIQNFVLSNDTDKAVNYLAKFSHLMRMILANSTTPLISLKDELKSLAYYLDLEQLRFDNKFEYEIIKDSTIDESFIVIPPMLLQPYAENAIIHGFVNSPKPGRLKIILRGIAAGTLQCIIEDNGIGREKAIEIRSQSGIARKPRGMLITQQRLEILNKQSRKNYSVQITDLKDEQGAAAGTRVEFIIQYQEI